jgi:starch synthase
MRVVFAAAELAPLIRVGGLGEVAGGLTRALRAAGIEVRVVVPDYWGSELVDETVSPIDVPEWVGKASARTGHLDGFGEVTLVDVPDIRRKGAYGDPGGEGYADNDRRFIRFSAAVAALCLADPPDLLHVNDWHTAAALAWIPESIATVISIHNLAYQGDADRGWLQVFGAEGFDRSHAYDRRGRCNPLAGGLILADRVIAVSPHYAAEIVEEPLGCGLSDILGARHGHGSLVGIINGIDTREWNPMGDSVLPASFGVKSKTGKTKCKAALQLRMDLPVSDGPLFGFVTRLTEQKGVEFVLEAAEFLSSVNGQLVVLGSGDKALADQLHAVVATNPERVAFHEGYDLTLSHMIFAGADCYMMPSRFEPCGLAQMQAMAYGTVPIVTDVGGLHDTVTDVSEHPDGGTGFVSSVVSTAGLVDAMHRASAAFAKKPLWRSIQHRGMTTDWSWNDPAVDYIELYKQVIIEKNAAETNAAETNAAEKYADEKNTQKSVVS